MDNTLLSTKKINLFNNELRDNSVWSGLTESNHLKSSFNIENKDMEDTITNTGTTWTSFPHHKNHLIGSGEYNLEDKDSDLDIDNEEDICIGGKDFFEPIKAEVTKEQLNKLKELQYKTGGTDINPKNVNHPKHYNNYSVEVIDMMEKIYGVEKLMVFCELNAFKYRLRAGTKNSLEEDLAKEKWYLDKLKELKSKL